MFDRMIETMLEDMHTLLPGKVLAYDQDERTATVIPTVRQILSDGSVVEPPIISNVPVVFPLSASGGVSFRLRAGDGVLLLFAESGIGEYINGSDVEVRDADDIARFTQTNCIAIPGFFPRRYGVASKDKPTLYSENGAEVSVDRKVSVSNDASNLRAEIEEIWNVVEKLIQWVGAPIPVQVAPSTGTGATVPGPIAAEAVTILAQIVQTRARLAQFLE